MYACKCGIGDLAKQGNDGESARIFYNVAGTHNVA